MAAAQPITFPSPGFLGLNKEREQSVLTPEWATEAQNAVIDEAGRMAARKGYVNQTTTPITSSPAVTALHEFIKTDSTTTLIAGVSNAVWESTDNGTTWTVRTGATAPSGTAWQFVNFNNKVIALVPGGTLASKTSGNFATIVAASGTVPTAVTAITAAFGRLWVLTKTNMYWCALLDETRWASADGAGVQDLGYLWTKGTDEGAGIGAFGSTLVVFGKRHIFLFTDGSGSDRGLDPTTMYVGDTIEGIGIAARDTLQSIGEGDMIFLGQNGIRTLSRVIQEKQTPLNNITGNSRRYFTSLLFSPAVSTTKMRSVFSPDNGFYLLLSPDNLETICVDVRRPLEDGSYRITEWPGFAPTSAARRGNGDVLFGFLGTVGKYSGYLDNTATYRFVFRSGWLDTGDQNPVLKILKRIKLIAFSPDDVSVIVKWFFDFRRDFGYGRIDYVGDGTDEYGIGAYGTAEYSGGLSQRIDFLPASKAGQYLLLGVETEINGKPFAVQSITAYYVPGRLA